ncbi:uncharacterized protein LOC135399211 isoform X2 [Ornithodoros turicata]|uniref:uncharacterized protein LOC135399211 isoform X2 n=1 Tax=Ornithodoros turicata TaxID=34597 RepID=UPI003138EB75
MKPSSVSPAVAAPPPEHPRTPSPAPPEPEETRAGSSGTTTIGGTTGVTNMATTVLGSTIAGTTMATTMAPDGGDNNDGTIEGDANQPEHDGQLADGLQPGSPQVASGLPSVSPLVGSGQSPIPPDTGTAAMEQGAGASPFSPAFFCLLAAIPLSIAIGIVFYLVLSSVGTTTTTTTSEEPTTNGTNARSAEGMDLENYTGVPNLDIVIPLMEDLGFKELGSEVAEQLIHKNDGDVVIVVTEPVVPASTSAATSTAAQTNYSSASYPIINGTRWPASPTRNDALENATTFTMQNSDTNDNNRTNESLS